MTTLFFYRTDPVGRRQRWQFKVDANQTIVEETPVEETPAPSAAVRDEHGELRVTHVSPDDRRILGFFSPSTPCWFPECEALRTAYRDEVKKLAAGCPACQKGAIIRKYQALVKKHEGPVG